MPPHLEAVAAIHFMIGVMDHIAGDPQHLALQLAQNGEIGCFIRWDHAGAFH
jgi:hypothetical protein